MVFPEPIDSVLSRTEMGCALEGLLCFRLVCDNWLEIQFPDAASAEQVLSSVISLRSTWHHLLQLRMEGQSVCVCVCVCV